MATRRGFLGILSAALGAGAASAGKAVSEAKAVPQVLPSPTPVVTGYGIPVWLDPESASHTHTVSLPCHGHTHWGSVPASPHQHSVDSFARSVGYGPCRCGGGH